MAPSVDTRTDGIYAEGDHALTLSQTLELIAPAEGPQDELPTSIDVLVVGAGPVGLTAANLLGSWGVSCLLVEQKFATSDMPKAIAIDDEYMRILDALDLVNDIRPHISRPFGVHFISPLRFVLAKVPGFITSNGFGNRNAVLQPVFEKILLRGCARFPDIRRHFGASVTAIVQGREQVRVSLQTAAGDREISTRYVLGCDGARSFIRNALNIPFPGSRIDEPHLVLDLADFPDQADYSRFFCNPRRPVNSVPAPYGGRRIEFMLHPNDDREAILTDASIRELVDRHTPYRGVQLHIIRRAVYGFSERIAQRFRDGRVFLLGDAAHVMPPFGGQGMNTGARDAANLCWKIGIVLRSGASERLLETYDEERREHTCAIVKYSVRVGRLANIRSRSLTLVRDIAFAVANLLPGVRRYFREMRHLPRPFFRRGFLARDAGQNDDGLTGRMLPRVKLAETNGRELAIDDAVGQGFGLIGFHVERAALNRAANHPLWRSLRPAILLVRDRDDAGDTVGPSLHAIDDRGRALVATHRGKILILRPDRYVAGATTPEKFDKLSDHLEEQFGLKSVQSGPDGLTVNRP
ncbi:MULTISPECIES: FAD-dependent monooxygenase [unclassified Bradyrhizobium]|uniref:FAD-dependent monooxygenase n=1 Tax=unclassified Bradyrhizobium TaxID=2631580 RepID=UPI00143DD16F|nr:MULTISPECIES: FAD-dependent monooxygenase [unclassified Bradyrhizobium]